MSKAAANALWPAIRSGDQRKVGQLLSDLGNNRTEWLRVNGGAAANLANANKHDGVAALLMRERSAALAADDIAEQQNRQLADDV